MPAPITSIGLNVSHADFAAAMQQIVLELDYSNFKDIVKVEQGSDQAGIYGEVWHKLWKLSRL